MTSSITNKESSSNTPQAPNNDKRQMNPIVAWFVRLFKGILIGIGAILPGLSGGVLSVIFGIYDPLIKFLSNLKKNFVKNVKFFLPVGIGAVAGIFLFSIAVEAAFGKYEAQFTCLFIGFVIGTIPSLYRKAGERGRSKKHIGILVVSALAIFGLMMLGNSLPDIQPNPVVWFFSGALVALGFIVPGLSPSNFLIYLGLYDKMAGSISDLDFTMIVPFAIGAVVCILLFAKLAAWLFEKFYAAMYHSIIGLVIGSSLAIFPVVVFPSFTSEGLIASGLALGSSILFSIIMLIVGIVLSYAFSKVEDRYSTD